MTTISWCSPPLPPLWLLLITFWSLACCFIVVQGLRKAKSKITPYPILPFSGQVRPLLYALQMKNKGMLWIYMHNCYGGCRIFSHTQLVFVCFDGLVLIFPRNTLIKANGTYELGNHKYNKYQYPWSQKDIFTAIMVMELEKFATVACTDWKFSLRA